MKLFCAKGSALPIKAAAVEYGRLFGRQPIVTVCGLACVQGDCKPREEPHGFVPEVGAGDFDMAVAGAESDMDDLDGAGLVAPGTRRSLGVREAAILVPAGRAPAVQGLEDLFRPGVRIAISTIDCLRGVWEDVCGRAGCIEPVAANITLRVQGCMAIVDAVARGKVDAAFGWASFIHFHPNVRAVRFVPEHRVYRSTCATVVRGAREPEEASAFIEFLRSSEGRALFERYGWVAGNGGGTARAGGTAAPGAAPEPGGPA